MSSADDFNKIIEDMIKQTDEEIAKLEKEKKKMFRNLVVSIGLLALFCIFIGYVWHG